MLPENIIANPDAAFVTVLPDMLITTGAHAAWFNALAQTLLDDDGLTDARQALLTPRLDDLSAAQSDYFSRVENIEGNPFPLTNYIRVDQSAPLVEGPSAVQARANIAAAAYAHTHPISDITGLQAEINTIADLKRDTEAQRITLGMTFGDTLAPDHGILSSDSYNTRLTQTVVLVPAERTLRIDEFAYLWERSAVMSTTPAATVTMQLTVDVHTTTGELLASYEYLSAQPFAATGEATALSPLNTPTLATDAYAVISVRLRHDASGDTRLFFGSGGTIAYAARILKPRFT